MEYTGEDTELILPESYMGVDYEIYKYAFYKRNDITSVTIPEGVTSIGAYAFFECRNLETIHFNATAMNDSNATNYTFDNSGVDGDGIKLTIGKNVTKIPAYLFSSPSCAAKITSVEFEEGSVCESIGVNAFYHCNTIENATIGNSVTTIGDYAFYSCYRLTSIVIPDSVTAIGHSAFYSCAKLSTVEIGNGVSSIGNCAFAYCSALTSIVIPRSVTLIHSGAFAGCTALGSVKFENPSGWKCAKSLTSTSTYSPSGLSDTSTAAKHLRSTYAEYYWFIK